MLLKGNNEVIAASVSTKSAPDWNILKYKFYKMPFLLIACFYSWKVLLLLRRWYWQSFWRCSLETNEFWYQQCQLERRWRIDWIMLPILVQDPGKPPSDLISLSRQLVFTSSCPQTGFPLCWGQGRNMAISVLLPLACNTCPGDSGHLSVQMSQFGLCRMSEPGYTSDGELASSPWQPTAMNHSSFRSSHQSWAGICWVSVKI